MKTKSIIIALLAFVSLPTVAQAEPLPLPPADCEPSRDEKGKIIVGTGDGDGCEKPLTAPSSECTACLYGCYPTSDGGTRCSYPPPEVGDFPIGAAKAEAAGHTCSLTETDGAVIGDCEVYSWRCAGGECEDMNSKRWGDPATGCTSLAGDRWQANLCGDQLGYCIDAETGLVCGATETTWGCQYFPEEGPADDLHVCILTTLAWLMCRELDICDDGGGEE